MTYKSLNMSIKQQKKYMYFGEKSYIKKDKLSVKIVENGVILPAKDDKIHHSKIWAIGGVLDENDNYVEESSSRYLFGGYYEHNSDYDDYIDEEVIFLGPFIRHWGHFICDEISRLWYVLDAPKKYRIAYCGWNFEHPGVDIDGNYLELLELLGIKRDQLINVQKPTRFKKIIIPEMSFIPRDYYHVEFLKLLDIITTNALKGSYKVPEKVYFTRSNWYDNDKERGENNIVDYLTKLGFEIKSPERLSLRDQIRILNNSKSVCMISGSISHNIMFNKSKNTIIILNKTDMMNDYQVMIDNICKANIVYIDIYYKIKDVLFGKGPFLMYVSKYMQDYFKTRVTSKISKDDIKWYKEKYNSIYSNPDIKQLLVKQSINLKKQFSKR